MALAGAAGAVSRYGIGVVVGATRFPWVTLGINISGSLVLGFFLTFATERRLSPELAAAVTVGFLGAYTTFSTFAWESFVMGRTDRAGTAAIYVVASVIGSIAAAWVGYQLGRAAA